MREAAVIEVPLLNVNEPRKEGRARLVGIDLVRGLIMIIMAWDHVKFGFANYFGASLVSGMWWGPLDQYHGNYGFFFARVVSHICAPLFSYLMGTGMVFVYESRHKKGWTRLQILRYFTIRSAVLICMGFVTNFYTIISWIAPIPSQLPLDTTFLGFLTMTFKFWDILSSLGLQMFVVACVLMCFPPHYIKTTLMEATGKNVPDVINFRIFAIVFTLLALICQLVSHAVVHAAQNGNPSAVVWADYSNFGGFLVMLFFLPAQVGARLVNMDIYPVFPWLGCAFFGVALAQVFSNNKGRSAFDFHGKLGLGLIIAFLLIRGLGTGEFGNLRGWPLGEGMDYPLMSFFNICKYPPSLAYCCLTLGIDFVFMYGLSFIPDDKALRWPARPLYIFGRVPFFYYMTHLLLIRIGVTILWLIQGQSGTFGIPLEYCIFIWIFIVASVYPMAARYDAFKSSTSPDSLWRLL